MAEGSSQRSTDARALDLVERALEQPSQDRARWIEAQGGSEAIRARALALLAAHGDSPGFLPTGGGPGDAGDSPLPDRLGAYRITDLIGQGGMGAVYRGERAAGDFEHTVAIKVIRPGALSGKLAERFRRERQTLARLAHPNIARLFDGGETDAGDPYIVMEFVAGQPLDGWREAGQPALPARLDLFVAVVEAVAYAHQNLVVHGDVTPSNILVDDLGRPKLIDFGIARAVTPDEAPVGGSARRSHSLTPGYAAPERIAGAPATTLSDIYSLGRVLQHLTAGSSDPELAAIVSSATAQEPQRRYPTAQALKADIVACRTGFPVQALPGGRGYVLRKFVARHQLGVGAAAGATALLLAALGLTLAANTRAEAARAEAEARFEQTRRIAKSLLFEVYDEVSKVPGSTLARGRLASTGLAYLDALASDPKAPLDVKVEAGRGYVRLSSVVGGGQSAQLGRAADASALLAKAEAVLRPALAAAPDDPEVRRAMAAMLLEQAGGNLYDNSQIALARKQALEAQAMLKPIARRDADAARRYTVAIQAEGDSYGWDGEYARSLEPFRRAEAFVAGLPPRLRDDTGVMKARSANLRLTAEAEHETGDDRAAEVSSARAVAVNRALVAREPGSPESRRKLGISLWYRSTILSALGRHAEALAAIDDARALAQALRAQDPADRGAVQLIALVGEVRALALADLGRFDEAVAMTGETLAAHRDIVARSDQAPGPRRSLAATMNALGGVYYRGGRYGKACAMWADVRAIYDQLTREGVLTGHDRVSAVADVDRWRAGGCNPPRGGMKIG